MLQLKDLCAALLVVSLGASVLEGARTHCDDNTNCPEDHCCLRDGEESMCTKLPTLGESCQPDALHDNDRPEDHQKEVHEGHCPCAAGLICSSAASGSKEGDDSDSSETVGVCIASEPEYNSEWQNYLQSFYLESGE